MGRGIARYLHVHSDWLVMVAPHFLRQPEEFARLQPCDGLIAQFSSEHTPEAFRHPWAQVVDVGDTGQDIFPHVGHDHMAIGRMGAEYFLAKGYRHFSFWATGQAFWEQQRYAGFASAIEAAGYEARYVECPGTFLQADFDRLASFERPHAAMGACDTKARDIAVGCNRRDLSVPEQVALLGVDNDEITCELVHTPISSVVVNFERIGYEAAAMLDRLLSGDRSGPRSVDIEPLRVHERVSTEMLAVDDEHVARSIRWLRDNFESPVTIAELVEAMAMGRRTLERHFREAIGRSPWEELVRLRMEKAARLLMETDLTVPDIASACGFTDRGYFSRQFKKEMGESPGQYRKARRAAT